MDLILSIPVAALILLVIWCYRVWTEYHDWWTQQNVPHIKAKLIPDCFKKGNSKSLHISEQDSYKNLGRIYGRFDGRIAVLTIGDAEILEKVFLKDFNVFQTRRDMKFNDPIMDNTLFILENPDWKRVRAIVSKAFTSKSLKTMLSILENSCDFLVENLERSNKSGKVRCQEEFQKFVLHSIGTCAFGMEMTVLEDPDNEFVKYSRELFQEPGTWRTDLTTQIPELMKVLRIKLLNPKSTEFFKAVVVDTLEERKKSDVVRKDFLQMIMDSENEAINEDQKLDCNNNEGFDTCPFLKMENKINSDSDLKESMDETPKKKKVGLSHDEVLSQCVTFFVAGFDSTSSLLSNAIYHLTKNKDIQERAYNEVIKELNTSNTGCLFDALNGMKYIEAIVSESLRMVPAMVRLERRCHKDYVVEHKGQEILLKEGMLVNIPTFAMHYDERYYPEPTKFNPDRFLKSEDGTEQSINPPRYAFLGFGEGQRKCIAYKFVYMWTKLCLAKILERFELVECNTTLKSLEINENRGILSIGPVEVSLKERCA